MKRLLSLMLVCALIGIGSINIFADQIVLKNGDRLTGKIVKKDGDKIVIETESAGVVTIAWAAVDHIVADQQLNIKLADGQLIKGTVTATSDDHLAIATKDAGNVTVEKDKIVLVRNDAEQAAFETEQDRILHPGFNDLWTGSADIGYALTAGNSETQSFTASVRGVRETTRDKLTLYANAIKSSDKTSGVKLNTASAIWFGGRYDYNLSKKTFAFGSADFEHDGLQLLDLRAAFAGGLGYRAIRSERTSLDLFGGAGINLEYYSDGTRRKSAEIVAGDDLTYKLNKRMLLTQHWAAYPNVSHAGRFRSLFDASLVTSINSWLGWHVTFGDRYNSDPIPGAKSNDVLFTTGLHFGFGRKK